MEIVRNVRAVELSNATIKSLPENVRLILKAVENNGQKVALVKGGNARFVLIHLLKEKGLFADELRYGIESCVNDLDICLLRTDSWEKQSQMLKEAGEAIQKALAAFEVTLEPKDTEFVAANNLPDAVRKILTSRDLTINEVILVYENGGWFVHYTAECAEDLSAGIGFLNPRAGLVWYVCGKVIPSPLGIARLAKYLVNGRVNKIVFPEYYRQLYLEEIGRRVEGKDLPTGAHKLPEGGSLGLYSLVLMKLYCQGNDSRRRAMRILKELGLTDLDGPAAYIREQELLFKMYGKDFELLDLTWDEIIAKQKQSNEMVNNGRKIRKDARAACEHQMVPQTCPGCGNRCQIEKCTKCTQVKFKAPLPCVAALFAGKTMWDAGMKGIFYAPNLPKLMEG